MPKREVILTSGHTEQNGWKERARAAEQKERWKILGKNKLTQIERKSGTDGKKRKLERGPFELEAL